MKLVLGALQWTAFIIAAAIVVPVAVAQSFHLDHSDSARLIQSTFCTGNCRRHSVFERPQTADQ